MGNPVQFDSNNRATFDFSISGDLYSTHTIFIFNEATCVTQAYAQQYLVLANDNNPVNLTGYVDVYDWRNTVGFDQALPGKDYINNSMVANKIRSQFAKLDNFAFVTRGIVLPDGRISGSTAFESAQQFLDWPNRPDRWNLNTGNDNGSPDGSPLFS